MIKLLLLCLCAYTAMGSPLQPYEIFDYVESDDDDAEIIEAAVPLPGTKNLNEKRVPVLRLTIPGGYLGFVGSKNLAERNQLPYHPQYLLPGVRNLNEKSLPEAIIARMSEERRHPKSEVEKVVLR